MKKAIFLACTLGWLAGCSRPEIKGDGVVKTEDRPVTDFTGVSASGGYRITWSRGQPALTISVDENLLPLIKTSVEGRTLRIDSDQPLGPTREITITISSADLSSVHLSGGMRFFARGISASRFELSATGASDVAMDGSVTEFDARLTGAGHLNAASLHAQNARLSLVGASDAHVYVTDDLSVSITGAGSLTYAGKPKMLTRSVIGSGRIAED